MATAEQINAVVDAVVVAFEGDPALWSAFLVRSKLLTERQALESQRTNMQADEDAQNVAYLEELTTINAQIAAKQAEIDAL